MQKEMMLRLIEDDKIVGKKLIISVSKLEQYLELLEIEDYSRFEYDVIDTIYCALDGKWRYVIGLTMIPLNSGLRLVMNGGLRGI